MGSPASTIQVDHSSTPVPGDNRILSNQHTPSTSDRTPLKKGLKNLRPTSPRRRPHMYVFLLLNFGRDLDPGPNTRGTLAHTRASVRQTLATLSKHLRCSRLNTWPKLCYQPRWRSALTFSFRMSHHAKRGSIDHVNHHRMVINKLLWGLERRGLFF